MESMVLSSSRNEVAWHRIKFIVKSQRQSMNRSRQHEKFSRTDDVQIDITRPTIRSLPWELLRHSFAYLDDINDLINVSHVCKEWKKASASNSKIWHTLVYSHMNRWSKENQSEFNAFIGDSMHATLRESYMAFLEKRYRGRGELKIAAELRLYGFNVNQVRGFLNNCFITIGVTIPITMIYLLIVLPILFSVPLEQWSKAGWLLLLLFDHALFIVPYVSFFIKMMWHEIMYIRRLRKSAVRCRNIILDSLYNQYMLMGNVAWIPLVTIGIHYDAIIPFTRWLPLHIFTTIYVIAHILATPRSKSTGFIPWYSATGLLLSITASIQTILIDAKFNQVFSEDVTWSLVLWPSALAFFILPLFILLRRTSTSYCAEIIIILVGMVLFGLLSITIISVAFKLDFNWEASFMAVFTPMLLMVTVETICLAISCVCLVSAFDGFTPAWEQVTQFFSEKAIE